MARSLSITDDEATELADVFRLIGDASRLKIVLACTGKPLCVSDIAKKTKLSASLVSHHLRLLRAARMVRSERDGKQVYYEVADDHVRSVIGDMKAHLKEERGLHDD
jgi:DNA-binding transcriptional ArsR family regulator